MVGHRARDDRGIADIAAVHGWGFPDFALRGRGSAWLCRPGSGKPRCAKKFERCCAWALWFPDGIHRGARRLSLAMAHLLRA